jgi:hypothetical protein
MSRASTECNGCELLVGILLDQEKINDSTSLYRCITEYILETKIKFNTPDEKSEYFYNLLNLNTKLIDSYIQNFRKNCTISLDDIDVIYISGKKNYHPEIEELNKGIDGKSIKSDVYIKLKNNTFIGISVKQCNNATKSNYSVQSFFKNEELDNELSAIKLKYLQENGFTKFDKDQRKSVNKLFYGDNPYFNRIKEEILIHEEFIGKDLCDLLHSSKITHYPVYEFDGKSMYKVNSECQEMISFKEHLPYYMKKNNERRNTAKLFYQLIIGSKCYRVEIRWKGNVFDASPQYQIHEEK